jgi:hypothetical protein
VRIFELRKGILVKPQNKGSLLQKRRGAVWLTGMDWLDPGSYSIWAIGLRFDGRSRTQAAAAAQRRCSGEQARSGARRYDWRHDFAWDVACGTVNTTRS